MGRKIYPQAFGTADFYIFVLTFSITILRPVASHSVVEAQLSPRYSIARQCALQTPDAMWRALNGLSRARMDEP